MWDVFGWNDRNLRISIVWGDHRFLFLVFPLSFLVVYVLFRAASVCYVVVVLFFGLGTPEKSPGGSPKQYFILKLWSFQFRAMGNPGDFRVMFPKSPVFLRYRRRLIKSRISKIYTFIRI